jgi:hypothetical protein
MFSGGEDRHKSGVLADRAGSGVVIHPPSPREVVVHVAGPRWPGFLSSDNNEHHTHAMCCKSCPQSAPAQRHATG